MPLLLRAALRRRHPANPERWQTGFELPGSCLNPSNDVLQPEQTPHSEVPKETGASKAKHSTRSAPGLKAQTAPCKKLSHEKSSIWEFPKIRGTLFGGPYNKDPTIYGTILGSRIFGSSQIDPGYSADIRGSSIA